MSLGGVFKMWDLVADSMSLRGCVFEEALSSSLFYG